MADTSGLSRGRELHLANGKFTAQMDSGRARRRHHPAPRRTCGAIWRMDAELHNRQLAPAAQRQHDDWRSGRHAGPTGWAWRPAGRDVVPGSLWNHRCDCCIDSWSCLLPWPPLSPDPSQRHQILSSLEISPPHPDTSA